VPLATALRAFALVCADRRTPAHGVIAFRPAEEVADALPSLWR
jgi:hypothetical protein